MIGTLSIAVAGLGAGTGVAAIGTWPADPYPLPQAVIASKAIHGAIQRFEETGVFELEIPPAQQPIDYCIAEYHPLEHQLWRLRQPPTPNCAGSTAAAYCIMEWFERWRNDLMDVHEAWSDAYCNCVCCYEDAGFRTATDCKAAMIEVFTPEFQRMLDRYNAFDPTSCCPAAVRSR